MGATQALLLDTTDLKEAKALLDELWLTGVGFASKMVGDMAPSLSRVRRAKPWS